MKVLYVVFAALMIQFWVEGPKPEKCYVLKIDVSDIDGEAWTVGIRCNGEVEHSGDLDKSAIIFWEEIVAAYPKMRAFMCEGWPGERTETR